MLNIGDTVRVKQVVMRNVLEDESGVWHRILNLDNLHFEGIYLGWTIRQTGVIQPGYEYGGPTDLEPRYQPATLDVDETHKVYVIQPFGKPIDRWRKPVLAFPEDVVKIDG